MTTKMTQIVKTDQLGVLLGFELVGTEPGIGSLNYLILKNFEDEYIRFWLYMANWFFVHNDIEIANCETPRIGQSLELSDFHGLKIQEIYKFDDDEIHIVFGDELRLEIAENIEAYGDNERKFFLVFKGLENSIFQFSYP